MGAAAATRAGPDTEPGQRLYIVFSRGQRLRFLSHLDMTRLWERALRRARLPLRYSQGYHPHPRLSLALPLSVGMTAEAEWLEVALRLPVSPEEARDRLAEQLPAGMALQSLVPAPWAAPALAARVQGVEYEVQVCRPPPRETVQDKVQSFLQAPNWPVQEEHKGRLRAVDLRAVVSEVELGEWTAAVGHLRLLLRFAGGRSARLDAVLGALGIDAPALFHRRRLLLDADGGAEKGA